MPAGAPATHDLTLLATGEGTNGWVAIRFHTDGAANDPEPINGFLYEAGQIGLELTYAINSSKGYIHAGAFGPLLNTDGTLNHGPVIVHAYGWDGGEVGVHAHGDADPANVDFSFDPVNGNQTWGGEGKTTYFHYPPEKGEYTALMFVAGDVTRWRWRFYTRPHNNVRIVGIERGEGSTYLFDGSRFGGPAVALDAGVANPAVRVANRAHIDAVHKLYGLSLASTTHSELRADAPNGSFDCRSCWFSRVFDPGRTTFHLLGAHTDDHAVPLVAYADARLP